PPVPPQRRGITPREPPAIGGQESPYVSPAQAIGRSRRRPAPGDRPSKRHPRRPGGSHHSLPPRFGGPVAPRPESSARGRPRDAGGGRIPEHRLGHTGRGPGAYRSRTRPPRHAAELGPTLGRTDR